MKKCVGILALTAIAALFGTAVYPSTLPHIGMPVPSQGVQAQRADGVIAACPEASSPTPAEQECAAEADTSTGLDRIIAHMPDHGRNAAFCFAPNTPPEVIAEFYASHPELAPPPTDGGPRYYIGARWSGGSYGDPKSLSWSLVPDGLYVDGYSSELFSRMDAEFAGLGGRTTWIAKITACFARWQALTGITYTRKTSSGHDWDDGAAWGSGSGTYRGDCRIAMIYVDGVDGVLGYSQYPDNGDTVLDRDENWAQTFGDYLFLRNVLMHEHGHGIGLAHVCPENGVWLMEPYINLGFDGPQHDDIRGGQRLYGDPYETNNTYAQATNLGTLVHGSNVTLGPTPAPDVTNGSVLSIDANGEQDWFKFTIGFGPALFSASVTPKGLYYDSSPQSGDGSCQSGHFVNSLTAANLNFQVIGTNGTTVIATADTQPSGSAESLSSITLSTAGTYYIKVYEGDSPTEPQLYWLNVQIIDPSADTTPPQPNPPAWVQAPTALSTTSVTMTANATDPSGVEYYFTATGAGSHSSGWQASGTYVDSSLQVNRNYTYKVKARDLSPQQNTTSDTSPSPVATMIETPTGLSFGAVTDTSIQANALGTFTRLDQNFSGLYFEVTTLGGTPAGSGTGVNSWTQLSLSQTATATGLSPGTTYRFRVKARNYYGANETPWYPATGYLQQTTTGGAACSLLGDINQDGVRNGRDIDGFVRAKLGGAPLPGENQACANYGGTLAQDITDFVADLLGL
ncbi:MAG TPA: matrixin family metalloprotease [Phycisphaerae bacterium]|nr:matrixin family metalloprotease [Phycisphaerae bacterium]